MKKLLALCLAAVFMLTCFTACDNFEQGEVKEISCEEIIRAYEDAGYFVTHGLHKYEEGSSQLCYIKASLTEEEGSDYIYFITCFTEEQAKEAEKTDRYNIFVWFYAAISGESRWLKTGTYGKIEYSYYNPELIEPFEKLLSQLECEHQWGEGVEVEVGCYGTYITEYTCELCGYKREDIITVIPQ